MAIFKCKMCGGDLEISEGISVIKCGYCETMQTIPSADNEKKIQSFNRANKLRMSCEFDRAASVYESIITEFPEEAEAYWGLCLCNYGIEYVDDPATGEKKPTCHRASFKKLAEDENFNCALDYADMVAKRQYTVEAGEIDRIMQDILALSKNESPYDIFICYKELDDKKERTVDSLLAEKLYELLTAKGYKVFFARISLEDKIGMQYEPYIFAALNSAKIMLSLGTKYEYFHAVWVKNEWSRFLRLAAKDKSKVLIPCYKDCDPYVDLPPEFKALQAQDLGKVGAETDLIRGIEKILGSKSAAPQQQQKVVVNTSTGATTSTYLTRAKMALEAGDFNSVNKFCENVLNMDPENSDAYLYKLLATLKLKKSKDLENLRTAFDNDVNYQRAHRFGDKTRKDWLEFCANNSVYNDAIYIMVNAEKSVQFGNAANRFAEINGFKDADEQYAKCIQFKELAEYEEEEARKERIYQSAVKKKEDAENTTHMKEAIEVFEGIPDYKDVKEQISECATTAIDWYYGGILREQKKVSIFKRVRSLSKLKIFSIPLFVAGIVCCFVQNNVTVGNLGAYILIAGLVIIFVIGVWLKYVESKYDEEKNKVKDSGSIFVALSALIFIYKGMFEWLWIKDYIKAAKKDIKYFEEQIDLLSNKTIHPLEDKKKESEKNRKKIARKHRSFNLRLLIFVVIMIFIVVVPSLIIPGIQIDKAEALYEKGEYYEAYNVIADVQNNDAVKLTQKIICARQVSEMKDLQIDQVFSFGFDGPVRGHTGKKIEEIYWRVLDIVDGKALVIENAASNSMKFEGATWEESNIRSYLNNEFIADNFSAEQKNMIFQLEVPFDGNPDYESQQENSTTDRVFLLSIDEAMRYFNDNEDRKFDSRYAEQCYAWYLRTPGEVYWYTGEPQRTGVNADGSISSADAPKNAYIRAAMWIDLNSIA